MSYTAKEDRWRELLQEFDTSDDNIAVFCRRHGVPVHRFYYWRKKFAASAHRQQLVPVVLDSMPAVSSDFSAIRVTLPNGVTIDGLDADALVSVLPKAAAL